MLILEFMLYRICALRYLSSFIFKIILITWFHGKFHFYIWLFENLLKFCSSILFVNYCVRCYNFIKYRIKSSCCLDPFISCTAIFWNYLRKVMHFFTNWFTNCKHFSNLYKIILCLSHALIVMRGSTLYIIVKVHNNLVIVNLDV